ncbi:MAG: prepilin-type N-terminal cleavage/methylation domain-containing protein [Phycisphaeraceae bacterium]|nr:prepilin-type N-terminal cleavage/methylation domain-containing protein [Phycisphaeraceae bacterium]
MRAQVRKAFTLVEILIVVVILGILAAIVIPQFTSASEEAQASSAASQLSTVRNQIELFRVRNNGVAPEIANLFTGDAADPFTKPDPGYWLSIVNADHMRVAPKNPRTGTDTIGAGEESDSLGYVQRGDDGWIYDEDTGRIWMNGFDESTGKWVEAP